MLKKENRLSRIEGNANEQIFNSPFFTVRISDGESATKFGFVVSKKISKSAVIRNRTKRVLRDCARAILEKISINKTIVLFAKKELEFKQKEEIFNILLGILSKAKIISL